MPDAIVKMSVRLDTKFDQQLNRRAVELRVSKADVIRLALGKFLKEDK